MIRMPGHSHRGPLPPLTPEAAALAGELRRDVGVLATEIGPRNSQHPQALARAADFIVAAFAEAGYAPERLPYRARTSVFSRIRGAPAQDDNRYENIVAERRGSRRPEEIVVIGAHYDSVALDGCRGANDNASGVAAVLALARRFADTAPARTLRFVAFVNEEPPYYWTRDMGSLVYARTCAARGERVAAMLSLETIGYYSNAPCSQRYPPPLNWLYPSTGDFIGFIGNFRSRALVRSCVGRFRQSAAFPSEGAALPAAVPGVGWSDHWSFWQIGAPALMVTDTAPYRYPYYHTSQDDAHHLDYERMARVVCGLAAVVADLAVADLPAAAPAQ